MNATNVCYGGNETAGINIWFNDGSQDPWQRARYASVLVAVRGVLTLRPVCRRRPVRWSLTDSSPASRGASEASRIPDAHLTPPRSGHCVDLRGCPDGCTDTNLYTVRDEVIFAIKAWLEFSRSK